MRFHCQQRLQPPFSVKLQVGPHCCQKFMKLPKNSWICFRSLFCLLKSFMVYLFRLFRLPAGYVPVFAVPILTYVIRNQCSTFQCFVREHVSAPDFIPCLWHESWWIWQRLFNDWIGFRVSSETKSLFFIRTSVRFTEEECCSRSGFNTWILARRRYQ